MRIFTTEDSQDKKIIYILIWLGLWYFVSILIRNPIILPSPLNVLASLLIMIGQKKFWISLSNSILKIGLGFSLGIFLGLLLAYLSFRSSYLKGLFSPPLDLLKSSPIASITIILLVWVRSRYLPAIIVTITVLPTIYYAAYQGFRNADKELLEVAEVFDIDQWKIFMEIYQPSLKLSLKPAILVSTGFAMKSGVSAEILAMTEKSIGENFYYSKLYLNTDELMAWTLVILGLSKVFYLIIEWVLRRMD